MLEAINAEIVQEDDIVWCQGLGGGDDVFIGLISTADAYVFSFGAAAAAAAAAIRRVCSIGSSNAIHLCRREVLICKEWRMGLTFSRDVDEQAKLLLLLLFCW
jgi:hypothetical protein